MPPFDVLTFDCYGTLVDWEEGISRAFAANAPPDISIDPATVLAAYARIEPEVQRQAFRSYREVLTLTAQRVAATLGWTVSEADACFLAESLPAWPVFPDTNGALVTLRDAGFTLGILSNVDDDLLDGTARQFAVPIDFRVTAQQVRAYKPAAAHFEAARAHVGGRRWLHVAQSWFHDVQPATAMGIPVVWVNRNLEAPGRDGAPITTVPNLEALAAWVLT